MQGPEAAFETQKVPDKVKLDIDDIYGQLVQWKEGGE